MGAVISSHEGCPPLEIQGGRALTGIHYDMPVASAQVKSSVLLAGLFAEGRTSVSEPAPTRDHTERMLTGFGYAVDRDQGVISLEGGGSLQGTDIDIPADISSAAFFLVGASIAPGSAAATSAPHCRASEMYSVDATASACAQSGKIKVSSRSYRPLRRSSGVSFRFSFGGRR